MGIHYFVVKIDWRNKQGIVGGVGRGSMNEINQSSGSHQAVWGKTVARQVHRPGVVSDRGHAARCENLEPLRDDFLQEVADFWS